MKRFLVAVVAILCVGLMFTGIHTAGAQTPPKKTTTTKPAAAKTYYVCAKCKLYYSAAAAAKVKYKDPMGHTLTKSATIPKGFKDGSTMNPAGKMGKMDFKSKM